MYIVALSIISEDVDFPSSAKGPDLKPCLLLCHIELAIGRCASTSSLLWILRFVFVALAEEAKDVIYCSGSLRKLIE